MTHLDSDVAGDPRERRRGWLPLVWLCSAPLFLWVGVVYAARIWCEPPIPDGGLRRDAEVCRGDDGAFGFGIAQVMMVWLLGLVLALRAARRPASSAHQNVGLGRRTLTIGWAGFAVSVVAGPWAYRDASVVPTLAVIAFFLCLAPLGLAWADDRLLRPRPVAEARLARDPRFLAGQLTAVVCSVSIALAGLVGALLSFIAVPVATGLLGVAFARASWGRAPAAAVLGVAGPGGLLFGLVNIDERTVLAVALIAAGLASSWGLIVLRRAALAAGPRRLSSPVPYSAFRSPSS